MTAASWAFALSLLSTFFCLAVNAYTLAIGYPLWRYVGPGEFPTVHREYLRRLSSVITLPHVLMFFSTAALVFLRPAAISRISSSVICGLAWATVGISAFAAGPVHDRFSRTGVCDAHGLRVLLRISVARTLMLFIASASLLRALLAAVR